MSAMYCRVCGGVLYGATMDASAYPCLCRQDPNSLLRKPRPWEPTVTKIASALSEALETERRAPAREPLHLWRVDLGDFPHSSPSRTIYVLAPTSDDAAKMLRLSGKDRVLRGTKPLDLQINGKQLQGTPHWAQLFVLKVELVASAGFVVADFGNVMEQPAEQGE